MGQGYFFGKLHERRAQILLPAVLLAPIFVLVIYLLFETAKVSVTKVRHQFALDNSAYSQLSSTSTYLNAVAMTNGPLAFRVLRDSSNNEQPLQCRDQNSGCKSITVFNLFYQSGAVPSLLGDTTGQGTNFRPPAGSTDWKIEYVKEHPDDKNKQVLESFKNEIKENIFISRTPWMREMPSKIGSGDRVLLLSPTLIEKYDFPATKVGIPIISNYLLTYNLVGSIYRSQDYVYKQEIKNMEMFRKAYFLNVGDCKKADCARESAAKLRPFLDIATDPIELDKVLFFFHEGSAGGIYHYPANIKEDLFNGLTLFQFAYLTSASRSKLHSLQRGVLLKQKFKLPRNHFNIDLAQKYKPYVRTKVSLTCPRGSNNCVWPNPLPKYNITLDP